MKIFSLLFLAVFLAILMVSNVGFAYSESTERCIDRITGVIYSINPNYSVDAGIEDDISGFCLRTNSQTDYNDLTEDYRILRDITEEFYARVLMARGFMSSIGGPMFSSNDFSSGYKSEIKDILDEMQGDIDELRISGLALIEDSFEYIYIQEDIDIIEMEYATFNYDKTLIWDAINTGNYVCEQWSWDSYSEESCVCLDNLVWDSTDVACVIAVVEEAEDDEVLVEEADVDDSEPENPFSDLGQLHKNYSAIVHLADEGVINGYPDGTFKPENPVNRAELLKILVEGKGITPVVDDYSNCFSDVKTDWYASYICYAKDEGWVDGYPDGSFKPAQTVNKVEAIKMLLNSQGVEIPESITEKPFDDVNITDWFAVFISKAKELGILEETGNYLTPAEGMRRAGICENLYRLINI